MKKDNILKKLSSNFEVTDINDDRMYPCYELCRDTGILPIKNISYTEFIEVDSDSVELGFYNDNFTQESHVLDFKTVELIYNLMKKLKIEEKNNEENIK